MATIKQGIASATRNIGKNNFTSKSKTQVGKVYGVVTTENTPTPAMFKKAGGFNGIGSVFYLEYNQAKNITGNIGDVFLDSCKIAKPLYPQFQYFPLKKELVYIESLPSSLSQISDNDAPQKYYINSINVWGNSQQNAQFDSNKDALGITFTQNPKIKPLLSFEGDHIIQGRQGSALRFSSTTKLYSNINEWSTIGQDDDPITILTNGFSYDPKGTYHVEKINKDLSSIYLTSAQLIPLQTDKTGVLNNLTNPIDASKYIGPQIIINSDRVVLNSKKDEVMIFAKTNIELNTKNIINLNADERIHLNSKAIFLGPYDATHTPQPLLLGNNTFTLLSNMISSLYDLGCSLSSIVGSPEGSPALDINTAGDNLMNSLERIIGNLNNILSKQNFTV
jgi:hypothetical protein